MLYHFPTMEALLTVLNSIGKPAWWLGQVLPDLDLEGKDLRPASPDRELVADRG